MLITGPVAAQVSSRVSRSYDLAELELEKDQSWGNSLSLRHRSYTQSLLDFDDEDGEGEPGKGLFTFVKEQLEDIDWSHKERWQLNDGVLTIVGTPRFHKRVKKVLDSLAEAASERAKVQISIVTVKDNSTSFTNLLPGQTLNAKELRTLKQDIQSRNGLLYFDVPNGARAVSRKLSGRNFVGDYEVNQTGVIPVLNPVVQFLRVGLKGEVQAHWDSDSDQVILEARFESCRALSSETLVFDKNRKIELPEMARVRLGTSVRVGLQSTTVLSQFIDHWGKHRLVLAVVYGTKVKELPWRRYSLRGFGTPEDFHSSSWESNYRDLNATGFGGGGGSSSGLNFGDDEEEEVVAPEAQLFQSLFKEKVVGVGKIGAWVFVKSQKIRDYVGLSLRNRIKKRSRLSYRIVQLELPGGVLPEGREFDEAGFAKLKEGGKVTREMSLSGFMRQSVQMDVFREKRIVTAISTQAGACLILPPTPDPIVACLNAGYRIGLRGLSETKDRVSFELSGQYHSFGRINGIPMKFGVVQFPQNLTRRDLSEKATVRWGHWAVVSMESGDDKTVMLCVRVSRLGKPAKK